MKILKKKLIINDKIYKNIDKKEGKLCKNQMSIYKMSATFQTLISSTNQKQSTIISNI